MYLCALLIQVVLESLSPAKHVSSVFALIFTHVVVLELIFFFSVAGFGVDDVCNHHPPTVACFLFLFQACLICLPHEAAVNELVDSGGHFAKYY